MKEKTYYSQIPSSFEIQRLPYDKVKVILRDNVEEVKLEDSISYAVEEYEIITRYSADLDGKIERDFEYWLNFARQKEAEGQAKKIREMRNRLLEESDKEMCLDRLGVSKPSGSAFGDWLAFLQQISSVMFGEMAQYRQELRDITKQEGFPYDVKFPEKPKTK